MESKRCSSSSSSNSHQSKKITTSKIPNFIPEEIIAEILSRLPVKSILKFRCVSKSWYSLISTPKFIKSHLKISSFSTMEQRVMVTICYPPSFNLKHCSALSLMCEPMTDVFELDYPKKNPNRAVWVVGSCNGLVCIAINENDLYLWNPSTRKSHKLPYVNVKTKPCYYNIFGFGYNELNDDYKVLGIFCSLGNADVYESLVKVYSMKSNSWKRIGDFNAGVPLDDSGKFVTGKIHLAASPALGFDFRWDIISLDLESGVYGMVDQPNYGEGVSDASLEVLGGCICVLCSCNKTRADLWVLKEYGVKESWTKVVTVPYFNDPGEFFYAKPLCMLPSGEILLVFQSCFVVYNPKDNSLRRPETSNLGEFLNADVYLESLVSPTPNRRLRREWQ